MWFTDDGTPPAIGRITPAGAITEYSTGLNANSNPSVIVAGADGNVWFTDPGGTTPAIGQVALQLAPAVVTGAATAITTSSATVAGTANPLGAATTTAFHYGTTPALGSTITAASLPAGGTARAVTAALSGLPAGATIYYQLTATNAFGTTAGATQTFKTAAVKLPPPPLHSATARLDNQLITLTTPSLQTCTANTKRLNVTLTSTTIPKSHATKLHFKSASFYIGKGIKHTHKITKHLRGGKKKTTTITYYTPNATTHHLPATLRLRIAGLSTGTHTLKVVVFYKETLIKHRHRETLTVSKTLTAGFKVC
jgi:hypothetical protein